MKNYYWHWILFIIAFLLTAALFCNQIFLCIPIKADSVFILFYVFLIGLLLLPMAKKLKIANLFEFERIDKEIDEIKTVQYLGEVIEWNKNLYYFTKNKKDGKTLYQIPDDDTAKFLTSNKGVISVTRRTFKALRKYNDSVDFLIDSVTDSKNIRRYEKEHFYALLSGKKYWMNATQLLELLPTKDMRDKVDDISISEFKSTPTGR